MKVMSKLIIITLTLGLFSCSSFERKFVKNKSQSAKLCLEYFPIKEVSKTETIVFKSDTVYTKGDSIQCPYPSVTELKEGAKESLKSGAKDKLIYVKCPDQKTINNTTEKESTSIVSETSKDKVLRDCENDNLIKSENIKSLKKEVSKKQNTIFYLYLAIGLYLGFRLIKSYINNKIKK